MALSAAKAAFPLPSLWGSCVFRADALRLSVKGQIEVLGLKLAALTY